MELVPPEAPGEAVLRRADLAELFKIRSFLLAARSKRDISNDRREGRDPTRERVRLSTSITIADSYKPLTVSLTLRNISRAYYFQTGSPKARPTGN
jgi:hypothetical protein